MSDTMWFINLTDDEQGQIIALRVLLDIDGICHYDNFEEFLDAARGKLCDMSKKEFEIKSAIMKYYTTIRATEECAELMSSGWVDGKAAKIMQDMYDAQSELFSLVGINYRGDHANGKKE